MNKDVCCAGFAARDGASEANDWATCGWKLRSSRGAPFDRVDAHAE